MRVPKPQPLDWKNIFQYCAWGLKEGSGAFPQSIFVLDDFRLRQKHGLVWEMWATISNRRLDAKHWRIPNELLLTTQPLSSKLEEFPGEGW